MGTQHVHHWKHGWVPLDRYAELEKDRRAAPAAGALKAAHPAGQQHDAHRPALAAAARNKIAAKPSGGSTADKLVHSIKANGGFTYSPKNGRLLRVGKDSGFAVAVPHTEHIVGSGSINRDDFARGVASVVGQYRDEIARGAVLGGWYSEERDAYMVELTHILPANDRAGAVAEGQRRNQEGIFALHTGEYIPTGGTGG